MNDAERPATTPVETEDELQRLTEHFLARLQAGEELDAYDLIDQYPHLACELEDRLESVQLMYELARPGITSSNASANSSYTGVDHQRANPPLPEKIGRYEITGVLGRGASAIVYPAFDPKFGRHVALKVFRSDHALGTDSTERFARDARIAARLRHPNIVPLHETGEDAGLHYIDMELISGTTLEAILLEAAGASLDFRLAATIIHKVAEALHYAHQNGVIHRDVKPSNILIDETGEPQITDFGLARRIEGETSITTHGQIVGTPAYMSPEQAMGQGHQADARTDIYSLGVVFYRLLTTGAGTSLMQTPHPKGVFSSNDNWMDLAGCVLMTQFKLRPRHWALVSTAPT